MTDKTGGPAFPAPIIDVRGHEGMTLRDFFAVHAPKSMDSMTLAEYCAWSYRYADAMLKAREL